MVFDCADCKGTGTRGGVSCATCGGDGEINLGDPAYVLARFEQHKRMHGLVWDMLLTNTTMPTNVFRSYEVLECLDATEHAALTDTQKDGVLHLLACGRVDLNDGKAGKVRLWNWFGAESTTVANLNVLLT